MPRKKKEPELPDELKAQLLLMTADGLPASPQKVDLIQEAVRLADAAGDLDLGMYARMELITAAEFGGVPDASLVAFAWCLAQHDAHPDRFDDYQLLWRYKWMVDTATEFPDIELARITSMLDDFRQRCRAAGETDHPYLSVARRVGMSVGDLAMAKEAHAALLHTPRSRLSDCEACVQNMSVSYHLDTNKPAAALTAAEPILAGRMKCGCVPQTTYSKVLLPFLFAGRHEEAARYYRLGQRAVGRDPGCMQSAAELVLFLAVTDNLDLGLKAVERHLPNFLTVTSPGDRFWFAVKAAFLFERLAKRGGPVRFRPPADFAVPSEKGKADPAAVRDWFAGFAADLAARFDARDGTPHLTAATAKLARLHRKITPLDLTAGG